MYATEIRDTEKVYVGQSNLKEKLVGSFGKLVSAGHCVLWVAEVSELNAFAWGLTEIAFFVLHTARNCLVALH